MAQSLDIYGPEPLVGRLVSMAFLNREKKEMIFDHSLNTWLRVLGWAMGSAMLALGLVRCSPVTPSVMKQAYQDQKGLGEISSESQTLLKTTPVQVPAVNESEELAITIQLASRVDELRRSVSIRPHEQVTVKSISIGVESVNEFRLKNEIDLYGEEFGLEREMISEVVLFVDMQSESDIVNSELRKVPVHVVNIRRGIRLSFDEKAYPRAARRLSDTLVDVVLLVKSYD